MSLRKIFYARHTSVGIDMFQTNADKDVIIGFESSMLKLLYFEYPRIWWHAYFSYYICDALINICLLCHALANRANAVKSAFWEGCCTCCVQAETARLVSHVLTNHGVNTGQTCSVGLDMLFSYNLMFVCGTHYGYWRADVRPTNGRHPRYSRPLCLGSIWP